MGSLAIAGTTKEIKFLGLRGRARDTDPDENDCPVFRLCGLEVPNRKTLTLQITTK
jgi:hypothetical protein